jgi:pimeloyl-ACP methyl ester carboxylesterase
MSKVRKGYVDVDGEQMHYRHLEGPGIPLVCLHQTASSGQMYLALMERLAGHNAVYALDTPGFGGSFDLPTDAKPTMTDYAAYAAKAIRGLGLSKAHVLGHHTGACIAVELAARNPDLIASLSMIGPVPLTPEERLEFSKHFGIPIRPTEDGSYLLENWKYIQSLGPDADVMLKHREVTDMMRAWWGRVQAYGAVWSQDFTVYYQQVSCPMLIMCAKDDVLWPFFERAREMRPDAQWAVPTGANFEPDSDPDGVANAMRDFLAIRPN